MGNSSFPHLTPGVALWCHSRTIPYAAPIASPHSVHSAPHINLASAALLADLMESSTKHGGKVAELVLGGISYLEGRSEFWQQQKPIYARLRERQLQRQSWARGRTRKPAEVGRYLAKTMEDIDMCRCPGWKQ